MRVHTRVNAKCASYVGSANRRLAAGHDASQGYFGSAGEKRVAWAEGEQAAHGSIVALPRATGNERKSAGASLFSCVCKRKRYDGLVQRKTRNTETAPRRRR